MEKVKDKKLLDSIIDLGIQLRESQAENKQLKKENQYLKSLIDKMFRWESIKAKEGGGDE